MLCVRLVDMQKDCCEIKITLSPKEYRIETSYEGEDAFSYYNGEYGKDVDVIAALVHLPQVVKSLDKTFPMPKKR